MSHFRSQHAICMYVCMYYCPNIIWIHIGSVRFPHRVQVSSHESNHTKRWRELLRILEYAIKIYKCKILMNNKNTVTISQWREISCFIRFIGSIFGVLSTGRVYVLIKISYDQTLLIT
jgi:hypothetical protein